MSEFTFQESTIEKAIEKAEKELGLNRESLEIEVLEEKNKGLLGLKWGKSVVLKAIPKSSVKKYEGTDAAAIAKESLLKILELSGLKADVELRETFDEIILDTKLDPEIESLFIGRRGKNLDSYQYILNKIVEKKSDDRERRIVVDCQGYRGRRIKNLEEMAKKAVAEVKSSGRPYSFPPMRASDRRIIHMTIKNEGFSTESRGKGDEKKVFILTPDTL